MTKHLFSEFNTVNAKAWKQKIQVDLKGLDYNSTLIWNSPEGINVKPFYNKEDLEHFETTITHNNKWDIGEIIYVNDIKKSNANAIKSILSGVTCIKFIIPNTTSDIQLLLQNIDIEIVKIQFETLFYDTNFITNNKELFNHKNVTFHHDCIGKLVTDGNWFYSKEEDFSIFGKTISQIKSLTINSDVYQNSGTNITQELAYTLSHLNDYFNYIENNATLKKIFSKEKLTININISVGSNYFFEIAKIRAIKLLISNLNIIYGFNINTIINTTPTLRNKTIYDYNTNMLRTTTECMSAILGGSNTVFNKPYDSIYNKSNEFGNRISRNQLLVLKHESYFNEVSNPSDGSYYIESLTQQLSEKSLKLFKNIESSNGFINNLFKDFIQQKTKESAQKEQTLFNAKTLILVGVNKFENKTDKMTNNLELYPFLKQNPRKTLIAPIIPKRLSETYEQNRLKQE